MPRSRGRCASRVGVAVGAAMLVLACGDSPAGPPDGQCADAMLVAAGSRTVRPVFDIAVPTAAAGPGTTDASIAGTFPRTLDGPATAHEQSFLAAVSVFDAWEVDAAGRPVSELVLILPHRVDAALGSAEEIMPVSLGDLRDPQFRPSGPVVVYAEAYDAELADYSRWFVGRGGCVAVTAATSGRIGRAAASFAVSGRWENLAGDSIGHGALDGSLEAPLIRLLSLNAPSIADTVEGTLSRGGGETTNGSTVSATQVLAPDETRLVVVAQIPGDSVREIRLVLPGVPSQPGEIVLEEPSLAEALAGEGDGAFGLVRIIVPGASGAMATELWRSIDGEVTLTNVIQNGPLALYGWVTGRYEFRAVAHDLTSAGYPETGDTLVAIGAFESRLRILPPTQTLVDTVSVPGAAAGS